MLMNHLSPDFETVHFAVGSKPGKENLGSRLIAFIRNIRRLRVLLRTQKFDLIQINPSLTRYSLIRESVHLALLNALHMAKSTVVFFHGWDYRLAERIRKNPLWREAFARIYNKPALIFVLCGTFREQLIQLGLKPEKIKITTTMYEQDEDSDKQSELEDRKNGKVQILFMSRFLKEKGVFVSAEVGRLLAASGRHDFKMVLAGDGEESQRLRHYILENGLKAYISTPGFISGMMKKKHLAESDIFLFPTFYNEGCPVVVLEALGAGLAIISTPVGAIADIVKPNQNGFLISSLDPRDFYEAIDRLIEDRELLRNIQRSNKKMAQENFEAGIVTGNLESVYRSILHA
jgi:glycosyltransferase involved in cell wall biosynthesis